MAHVSTDTIIRWLNENDRNSHTILVKESMTVSLKLYEPGSSTDAHDRIHEEDELYYVISGSGKVRVEDDVFSITDGDTIFVEAGDMHTFFEIDEKICVLKIFPTQLPSAEGHQEELPFE